MGDAARCLWKTTNKSSCHSCQAREYDFPCRKLSELVRIGDIPNEQCNFNLITLFKDIITESACR